MIIFPFGTIQELIDPVIPFKTFVQSSTPINFVKK